MSRRLRRTLVPARPRRTGAAAVVLAATVVLAACGAPAEQTTGDAGAPADTGAAAPAPEIERTAAPLEAALTVTDPTGAELTLPAPPERIVCLSGLCDDIVVELGLTPAGTSTPALLANPVLLGDAAEQVPVVAGSFGSEDVESIAALEPDLVIGLTGVHEPLAPAVEQFAPLWLAEPADWEESVDYLRALGALTGRTEEAVAAEERFRGVLADAVATTRETGQVAQRAVLMYGSPDTIGVATTSSLTGGLLAQLYDYPFPARSADVETASTYSLEEILAQAPDVVFVYSLLFSADDVPLSEQLADNPVWAAVPAVAAGQVTETDPRLWGSGRGTRSLGAIVEQSLDLVPVP